MPQVEQPATGVENEPEALRKSPTLLLVVPFTISPEVLKKNGVPSVQDPEQVHQFPPTFHRKM